MGLPFARQILLAMAAKHIILWALGKSAHCPLMVTHAHNFMGSLDQVPEDCRMLVPKVGQ